MKGKLKNTKSIVQVKKTGIVSENVSSALSCTKTKPMRTLNRVQRTDTRKRSKKLTRSQLTDLFTKKRFPYGHNKPIK